MTGVIGAIRRAVRALFLAVALTLLAGVLTDLSDGGTLLTFAALFVLFLAGARRPTSSHLARSAPMPPPQPATPALPSSVPSSVWAVPWDQLERTVGWRRRKALRADRAAIERLVSQADALLPGSEPHDVATWSARLPDRIGNVLDAIRDGDDAKQILDPLLTQIARCAERARASDPMLVERRNRIAVQQRYFDERLRER